MKGIKEWAIDVASNEELAKKFEGISDSKKIIELAKKEGYEFTEQELMDLKMEAVSGGKIDFGKVLDFGKKVYGKAGDVVRYGLREENWNKFGDILRKITRND